MNKKKCRYCNKLFTPKTPKHLFCSRSHCDHYNNSRTWDRYFKKLLNNNATKRKALTTQALLELFDKQGGKCAISGVKLTKLAGKGQVSTNASIDRIKPGGPYKLNNIRLVCNFINSFRGNLSDSEFFWWCKEIVKNNGRLD